MASGVWVNAVHRLGALVKQSKNERKGNETFFWAYSLYPSISLSGRNVRHQCLVILGRLAIMQHAGCKASRGGEGEREVDVNMKKFY